MFYFVLNPVTDVEMNQIGRYLPVSSDSNTETMPPNQSNYQGANIPP
jgi:hypothetical protein